MTDHIDFIELGDFLKIDIRVGVIHDVQDFPKVKKPAFKLWVDFGHPIGIKKTSAQITQNYTKKDLIGKQIAAVINFPPKQIIDFMSEILVLGFPDEKGNVTLISPDKSIPIGGRLY